MTDEYNPADLAQDKRMSGEFASIDAYQIVRDAAQTPGRPITRVEALAISHATLENAEAERIASDDAAVSIENDVTRESFLRGLRLVRDADNNVSLCGPDGDHVIDVHGNLGLGLSADQIGSWVVTACHAYAELLRDPMTAMQYIQQQGYHDVAQYYEDWDADAER